MFADRDAVELNFPFPFRRANADQREVRRASPHVANQNLLAGSDQLVPILAVAVDPRIKGRLRLLDQYDAGKSAWMVSSRATSSNDAGNVSTISWSASRSFGWAQSHASRMCCR